MTTRKDLNVYIRHRLGVPDDAPRQPLDKPYACRNSLTRRHDHPCYCKPAKQEDK